MEHPERTPIKFLTDYTQASEETKKKLDYTRELYKELAMQLADVLPDNAEATAGLRKLVEAKDCHVRAFLDR